MNDEETKKRFSQALEDLLLEEDIENIEIKEENVFENNFYNEKNQNCQLFINNESTNSFTDEANENSNENKILWQPGPSTEAESNKISQLLKSQIPPNIMMNTKLNAFRQFINDEIIQLIIKHTNLRGIYIMEQDSNFQWIPVDKFELEAFFGLLIFHGVMKCIGKPFSEFWSQEFGFPIFIATMTCKRMLEIIRCLRFDNMDSRVSRKMNSGDKAEAVREFLNLFSLNCRTNFICSSDVVVGRKVYCKPNSLISNQSTKMEIFYAADIHNNYITNLEIPNDEQSRDEIVINLTQHLNGSGRNIFTDSNCTSYLLSQKLKENNLRLTGFLSMYHENLPNDFFTSELNSISYHINDTTLFSYSSSSIKNDGKIILSTLKFEEINEAHEFYDETMNNFHKLEMMIDKYTVQKNTKRWPLAIFYNIIDIATLNAYSIYNYANDSFERRKFLLDLAKELVESHISQRLNCTNNSANEKIFNAVKIIGFKHLISRKVEIFEKKKIKQLMTRKRGRCFNCPRSMDRKSSERCDKCFAFVCTDHRGVLCVMCLNKVKNFDAKEDDESE